MKPTCANSWYVTILSGCTIAIHSAAILPFCNCFSFRCHILWHTHLICHAHLIRGTFFVAWLDTCSGIDHHHGSKSDNDERPHPWFWLQHIKHFIKKIYHACFVEFSCMLKNTFLYTNIISKWYVQSAAHIPSSTNISFFLTIISVYPLEYVYFLLIIFSI